MHETFPEAEGASTLPPGTTVFLGGRWGMFLFGPLSLEASRARQNYILKTPQSLLCLLLTAKFIHI